MVENSNSHGQLAGHLPLDDQRRTLAVIAPDDERSLTHVAIAGGTYTILLTGDQTAGRYCLIEMLVPPGAGPPPHRHDFEEMFMILEGAIELTFRGRTSSARAGATVNVPANAPHSFRNVSDKPARLLCMCTPPGQERYFMEVGEIVTTRTVVPPQQTPLQAQAQKDKAMSLAAKYRTEFLPS